MMFAMNLWSCLWALIGIILTSEYVDFFEFLKNYPYVMSNIFLLGLTGAIGQVNKNSLCRYFIRILFLLEFYFLNYRMVWPVDVFDLYNNAKVFYDTLFGVVVWKYSLTTSNSRYDTRFSRTFSRANSWKEKTMIGLFCCFFFFLF